MNYKERLLFALAASPMSLPLLWLPLAIYWGVSIGEIEMGLVLVFMPVAYLVAAILGLPMLLLSRALGWTHVLIHFCGGIIAGLAAMFVFRLIYGEADLTMFALCGTAGAISGVICWFILYRFKNSDSLPVSAKGEI
jgi:energy-converting hydrogenase Eha subunit A